MIFLPILMFCFISLGATQIDDDFFDEMLELEEELTEQLEEQAELAEEQPEMLAILSNKEVCMKELGCFSITSDFRSLKNRPINVLPNDREVINTKFLLYTKRNVKEPEVIYATNAKAIQNMDYKSENPTKFIIHGFMDSDLFGPWMRQLKDEFLHSGEYNIFLVDWSGGNKPPYYQATANTRVVGAEIALFIEQLGKYFGKKPEDCHLIGHSLGAHIAGYTGKRLKNLGRITALDAAEPYFQNMPASVRIDKTDAQFVDAIHSDSKSMYLFGLGMSQMVGHIDFFPNNGRDQPGCVKEKFTKFILDGLTEGLRRFVSCNHQRAVDFFQYSINYNKALPVSYACDSYESYLNGKCNECGSDLSKCAILGLRADEYPNRTGTKEAFYIKTSGSTPFWVYHYHVTVHLLKGKYDNPKGSVEINLLGNENLLATFEPSDSTLKHGDKLQFLVTSNKDLGEINSLSFKWLSSSKNPLKLVLKPKLYVQYVSVIPLNTVEKSPRTMTGRIFCGSPKKEILPKTSVTLSKNNKCDVKT